MMANLTIKQVEDYVGKDVAEKIQNEEGKVGYRDWETRQTNRAAT